MIYLPLFNPIKEMLTKEYFAKMNKGYSSAFLDTGAPPITLLFGPEKNYRVIGKTVLKED